MYLQRSDLNDIQKVLDTFPEVKSFEIIKDDTSGIGYTLDISFDNKINGIVCKVIVPVVTVDSW
jgi:hypothetical protein